jgi:ribonuclease G
MPQDAGFIVRTAAAGVSEDALLQDSNELIGKWNAIKKDASRKTAPSVLLTERDLVSAVIRDHFNENSLRCIVDNKKTYDAIVRYIKEKHPHLADRVYYFSEKAPIFEVFGVEKEIEKGLRRKVWLKKGGSLIFDHAEAMTVIDVNTGRNVGKKDAEETLLRNNLEAAEEIARQLRLRDIGGIIAIDFVDMKKPENRKKLLDSFRTALKKDPTPTNMGGMSDFGIVLLTRKREGQNLHAASTEICEACGGSGRIFSKSTVLARLDRQLLKIRSALGIKKAILVINPGFAHYLRLEKEKLLKEIQKAAGIKLVIEESTAIAMDTYQLWDTSKKEEFTSLLQPVEIP